MKKYHQEKAPTFQPLSVEKEFKIAFKNVNYKLVGFIDLIDSEGRIREHKTSARAPSIVSESHRIQGTVYALAENKRTAIFDYAIKSKPPRILTYELPITQADKTYALRLVGYVDHAVKHGVFYPNRSSLLCSRKFCAYWNRCQKDFGGKVRD